MRRSKVVTFTVSSRERGVGVVFITHNPHHAHPVGDRFVLLRRGEVQGDFSRNDIRLEELATMMAGGEELDRLTHELDRAGNGGASR